jgi:hypothetical protein
VERRTQDLPTAGLLFVAPTRVLFDSTFMRRMISIGAWSWLFLVLSLIFLFALRRIETYADFWHGLFILLWVLPSSRIFEIGYAFYNDSFDQMHGLQPRSGLRRSQRFKLLGRSYFEIAVCYASLYLALPGSSFDHAPATGFESLYFSWITITTTGYGDIAPRSALARGLCMTEVGVGLALLVFAIGTSFSYRDQSSDENLAHEVPTEI